jgi:hypothetical protein
VLLLLVVVAVLLLAASVAYANVRTGGAGDVPFYARIERGSVSLTDHIVHTDEWAAIVFYRPPECVPDGVPYDFDLLDFFDFGAFGCTPPTTDGFMIWESEPGPDSTPIQINLHGLGAVPVWFVSWPELLAAVADDNLPMSELKEMDSLLIGSASFYKETLHPAGGAQIPTINFVAHGRLQDGRSFQVHATGMATGYRQVKIGFQ